MDHATVVRENMTEQYLLDEMDPELRDRFEEHYFVCPECAQDVVAGAGLIEHSKNIWVESEVKSPVSVWQRTGQWFAAFRPSFAVPAFALLLVGFLGGRFAMQRPPTPYVAPVAQITLNSWGDNAPLPVQEGKGFILFLRVPAAQAYASFTVDLRNPAGGLEYSLTFPATAGQDQWPLSFPGVRGQSGTYRLAVRGTTSTGESTKLGEGPVELQIQK